MKECIVKNAIVNMLPLNVMDARTALELGQRKSKLVAIAGTKSASSASGVRKTLKIRSTTQVIKTCFVLSVKIQCLLHNVMVVNMLSVRL